jgi:glycosyltransferase involved in cell wall biosynthesis
MRILFVHKFFPGQFVHLAAALAADPAHDVVFLSTAASATLPGVRQRTITASRKASPRTHHYLQSLEDAVLLGQAAFRECQSLIREGFRPDVIYAHAGFGPGLYMGDAFPNVPLLGYFEWFYRSVGADADFLAPRGVTEDERLRIRMRNAALLLELTECACGVCPTAFQRHQFPPAFQRKLVTMHDGVDSDYFKPAERNRGRPRLPILDLPEDAAIVTYTARGLEPYRGFPQFLQAIAIIQQRRPEVHAIIVGSDRVYYSPPAPGGRTYKALMLERLPHLDHRRLHFIDVLSLEAYRSVLQASAVHVYLTVPFVLSWSLIEAMATGCTIVASDTAPVREVIAPDVTGLLADFRDPCAIAERVTQALADPDLARRVGAAARVQAVDRFALGALLPRQIDLLKRVAERGIARGDGPPNFTNP